MSRCKTAVTALCKLKSWLIKQGKTRACYVYLLAKIERPFPLPSGVPTTRFAGRIEYPKLYL